MIWFTIPPFVLLAGLLAYVIYLRHRKTYMTRRYARMLYFNGIISMEELNRWYAVLPPEPEEEEIDGKPA